MKAEPETRIVKGHDVRFSAQDFERDGTTSWEGVRNHEAKKLLKETIQEGDKVLFYASNTKVPAITAHAHIIKSGYPDHNAWDPNHPYYDPKSLESSPTWFMVDLQFDRHLPHPVSLKLLQHLASLDSVPECMSDYLTEAELAGFKTMALINRGRLSVQPVEMLVYGAIVKMGDKGGWEEMMAAAPKKVSKKRVAKLESDEEEKDSEQKKPVVVKKEKTKPKQAPAKKASPKKKVKQEEEYDEEELSESEEEIKPSTAASRAARMSSRSK